MATEIAYLVLYVLGEFLFGRKRIWEEGAQAKYYLQMEVCFIYLINLKSIFLTEM
jgi:hypothetical protein